MHVAAQETVGVEQLAQALHEAGRAAVEGGQTLAQEVTIGERTYTRAFVEWADLPEHAREGRRIMARWLLARYQLIARPIDPLAVIIAREPVTSSSTIIGIGYDEASGVLEVVFSGEVAWRYYRVPPAVWAQFRAADSKGRFFHAHIRDACTAIRVPRSVSE